MRCSAPWRGLVIPDGPHTHVPPEISTDVLRAVDMLNLGILVLDCEGRIGFANRAAEELLRQPDGKQTRERSDAFDQVRAAMSRHQSADAYLAVSTGSRKSLIVLIVPIRNDETPTGRNTSILFVSDPDAEIDLRPIARLYGLTRAETRLLQALLAGERVGTYAKQAGITLNTAKGYLKHLFSKTQTSRQADLVRVVLGNPGLRLVSTRPEASE